MLSFVKPTKKVGFSVCSPSHDLVFFVCFWPRIVSRPQNRNGHKQLSKHQSRHYSHLFLPTLGKKYIYSINWSAQSLNLKGFSPGRPLPRCCWTNRDLFHFASHRPSLRNDGSSRRVPWPFQPVPGVFRLRSVFGPRKKR